MIPPRNRAFALLAAAFALGLLLGGASLMMATRAGKADFMWQGQRRGGPGGQSGWLARELELDAATRERVDTVYCRAAVVMDSIQARIRPAMDSLFETIRPDVEARRQLTRTEIRALLSPPQQEKYDSINRANDENRRRMREQGPNRGPCGNRGAR
jgi:hypothetical protein